MSEPIVRIVQERDELLKRLTMLRAASAVFLWAAYDHADHDDRCGCLLMVPSKCNCRLSALSVTANALRAQLPLAEAADE